jgi:hypothetical protein
MGKIVRKITWIVAQCAAVAVVALATNLLESAGALPYRSVVVTEAKPVTVVDRSQKGDRLTRVAPSVKVVVPYGCESSVSSATKAVAVRSLVALRHLTVASASAL